MVFFSLLLVNCDSGILYSGKAKDLIDSEIDTAVNQLKENYVFHMDEKKLKKEVAKLKQQIKVDGVRQEGNSFIAIVNVSIPRYSGSLEIKFNKYDTGWRIDELKMPNGSWVSKDKAFKSLGYARKRSKPSTFAGKIKATMSDMKSLGTAIESYITDNEFAPQVDSIAELELHLSPFHTKVVPKKDAWGNNFHYEHGNVGTDKQDLYWIGSGGSDGKFEGSQQKGKYYAEKGKDIIFSNGYFPYAPIRN